MPDVRVEVGARELARRELAVAGLRPSAIFTVEGPGALECLQGIFCNDLAAPGDGSLVYGAFLTPKGMIAADAWVIRAGGGFTVVLPASARETMAGLLRRSLPPRLARHHDRSGEWQAAWLGGLGARAALDSWLGPGAPAIGRAVETGGVLVGAAAAPFTALLSGPAAALEEALDALGTAGAASAGEAELEALRILAGWPALGAEIDGKTLPQEVRFDEHAGVSYTKGCYVGQETVARLHFRGHPNRELRGLAGEGAAPSGDDLLRGGRPVGRLRSLLVLPDRWFGLAPVRREVEPGTEVDAGGAPARVIIPPFPAP